MTDTVVNSWFGPIHTVADPEFAPLRSTRRQRGRRRYYRTLQRDAKNFEVKTDTSVYDYMHWHVDWTGLGNDSWAARHAHLVALFTSFHTLMNRVEGWLTPHQCWVRIDPNDSAQDAVYLHTPNPNAANFPNEFIGVQWDAPVPPRLQSFITPGLQFGRNDDRWTQFYARVRPAA